ncbi:MAG TPA: lytic transglycosylase domain-containing protein, partial [Candidatus Paceibacterota bacterium]|nr:lytic transglycosylase domain-containing protein [Candidatus Paceibacterota bacterium]
MKRIWPVILMLGTSLAAAQDNTIDLGDLDIDQATRIAQEWAKQNLDDETLRSLPELDQAKVKQFLDDVQKKFQGEYVIDLAQLRDVAKVVLPLLESHDETKPYAAWLKSRMDYLDVAEELRLRIPPPKIETNQPTPQIIIPKPEMEREIWIKKFSDRPWPPEAKPYVTRLKPVFARQKTPEELVWIAEVESSFDPQARSPAGAAGLFQLMPATAKQYGLKTWPLDQRYRPEESASAAAQHLAYLHRKFKDWRLAIAAYNAGEGTVQRLLDRSREKSYDAIAGKLPAETQMYVPKVEA